MKKEILTASLCLVMEDGSTKDLMTFEIEPLGDTNTRKALSLIQFEEDVLEKYIKFVYKPVESES